MRKTKGRAGMESRSWPPARNSSHLLTVVTIFGVAMIALHNLLDPVQPAAFGVPHLDQHHPCAVSGLQVVCRGEEEDQEPALQLPVSVRKTGRFIGPLFLRVPPWPEWLSCSERCRHFSHLPQKPP